MTRKGVWIVTYDTDPYDLYNHGLYTSGVFSNMKQVREAHPNIYWHEVKHQNGDVLKDHYWGDAVASESFQNSHYTADFYELNKIDDWFLMVLERNEQRPVAK